MALLAAATLLFSGTPLDRVWLLNPRAYRELAPFGKTAGIGFAFLASLLAMAAIGWFRRRLWGGDLPWLSSLRKFSEISRTSSRAVFSKPLRESRSPVLYWSISWASRFAHSLQQE